MRIVVVGGNGQLGSDTASAYADRGDAVVSLTHADIELSNLDAVRCCLGATSADVVVNTAAMHHVEKCEEQPEKAFAVNAIGARNLALVTRELAMVLVHISTDYVFDGAKGKPYHEGDVPLPLNVYGNSKLAGEYLVRTVNPRHFVLRTSALYGKHPCRAKGGQNFVDLMLRLGRERGKVRVVDTEFVSPTSTTDLARQIVALSGCDAFGLYHATGEGSCSWYEYAKEIYSLANLNAKVEVASSSEFPAKVARPSYSVLENRALNQLGLNTFRPWQEALAAYLAPSPALCETNA
jgi:dTDP-4-dehydrorhamnose reductase